MTKFEDLFTSPAWRWSTNGCYPNRLAGNGKKVGAVVVARKAGRGADFALSRSGLDAITSALADGRLTEGYVVLAAANGTGNPTVVASAPAAEVAERMRDVPAHEGKFGQYWWISETFATAATLADSGVPF